MSKRTKYLQETPIDYENFKFDRTTIEKLVDYLRSRGEIYERTVYEDYDFNLRNHTRTGCNGNQHLSKVYDKSIDAKTIAAEIAGKCNNWEYREMHIICYWDGEIQIEVDGGLYQTHTEKLMTTLKGDESKIGMS